MNAESGGAARRRGRNDPGRRDRIVAACLDVVAADGVTGASHRRIADAAGVPLGSMTYYFTGMRELLHDAFSRFAEEESARFAERLAALDRREQVLDAIGRSMRDDVFSTRRQLVLTHELYTLAARDAAYRDITTAWMVRSRRELGRFFDADTARIVDALIEGLTLHRALDTEEPVPDVIDEAIKRIAPR